MTISEMHIELDQSNQQIAANVTRKYLPEEKDWILNKVEGEFIQSLMRPKKDGSGGFEFDQLAADALRTIIISGHELTPYIDNEGRYKCVLPSDYAYLLSDQSLVELLCSDIATEVAAPVHLYGLRQDYSGKNSPSYYQSMQVYLAGRAVNIPSELPFGNEYSGYQKKKDISFIVPWISAEGKYYWERFGDVVKRGYYIAPAEANTPIPTLTIDGSVTSTNFYQLLGWSRHESLNREKAVDNRLTPSSKIPSLLNTKFYQTAHYGPISELSGGLLYIYRDSSFIVSKVRVSYVRKCRPMSLSLGCNSELPEQFHQTICDLAVQYMKGRLENQVGEALAEKHNETRVVL